MSNLKNILINKISCKSIWFMRQAGRYLPEFRKIRSKNKNFIKLCLNSKLSSEITLQPIRRFNLDSAIIFSDILMVPYGLGQDIKFIEDKGPVIRNFNLKNFLNFKKKDFNKKLRPVYSAIKTTKKRLEKEKSLICFVGAPWTLLIYLFGLKINTNNIDLKKIKGREKEIKKIFNKLNQFLCLHIKNQVRAGADVVQIFDSWAGLIPKNKVKDFCFKPNKKIVDFCKSKNIPIICFPKGIKKKYLQFNNYVRPHGISLDYQIKPEWAYKNLKNVVIQGGLDPKILLKSDKEIFKRATRYLKAFKGIPYVFNLGHGLLPKTDPGKVHKLIKFYRNF